MASVQQALSGEFALAPLYCFRDMQRHCSQAVGKGSALPDREVFVSDDRIEEPSSANDATGKETYARRLNERGTWFVVAGQPHLAVRCFRRACVACPRLAVAWTNLATTLALLGRNKDALLAIRSATKAGALSRGVAARCRTAIRQRVSADQLALQRKVGSRKMTVEPDYS